MKLQLCNNCGKEADGWHGCRLVSCEHCRPEPKKNHPDWRIKCDSCSHSIDWDGDVHGPELTGWIQGHERVDKRKHYCPSCNPFTDAKNSPVEKKEISLSADEAFERFMKGTML